MPNCFLRDDLLPGRYMYVRKSQLSKEAHHVDGPQDAKATAGSLQLHQPSRRLLEVASTVVGPPGYSVYLKTFLQVTGVAVDASGQWLASTSWDGTARVWEVATGRCMRAWQLGSAGLAVAWCPDPTVRLVSAVTRNRAVLLPFGAEPELHCRSGGRQSVPLSHPVCTAHQPGDGVVMDASVCCISASLSQLEGAVTHGFDTAPSWQAVGRLVSSPRPTDRGC